MFSSPALYWENEAKRYAGNADYWREMAQTAQQTSAPSAEPLTDALLNARGLDYARSDAFSSDKAEWVAQDIADAFKAGARAAERYYGITAQTTKDETCLTC
jgi:hypothetical protein